MRIQDVMLSIHNVIWTLRRFKLPATQWFVQQNTHADNKKNQSSALPALCEGKRMLTTVRLQNLPWSKTGLVSRQVLHPLSKLQNWIWSKTGRYKTGLVSNTKIEASLRATKPKPWQSKLTSDTVEIFIQNEKAGLVPMQSRFRSRHKAGFGAAGLGTAQSWFWSRHKASFGAVSRPI